MQSVMCPRINFCCRLPSMSDATLQVQELYERHPYPHYPLLAKPRWQDGYLGSSLFARHQFAPLSSDPTKPAHFLSIGSGEILPYIIRQWEPSATKVACVDLSKRSLRRASFRTALLGRQISFHRIDINEFLAPSGPNPHVTYDHIEAYGVLHHISSFQTTLSLIRKRLAPSGLLRLMVYNAKARDWIWDLNRGFAQLGLKFTSDQDVRIAREILLKLALFSPRLEERLTQMGRDSIGNNTRFADTFLHPWEARADIFDWFNAFAQAGLKPVGLFDRYAELDDLDNPLWKCPSAAQLSERALDIRFENNLELWLTRDDFSEANQQSIRPKSGDTVSVPLRLRLTMPPSQLANYKESRDLTVGAKLAIWQGYLRTLYNQNSKQTLAILQGLDLLTLKRLARIGILLPETAKQLKMEDSLMRPIHTHMTPPAVAPGASTQVIQKISEVTVISGINPQKRDQAIRRFTRALS